jgi:hypothetical protein
MSSLGDVSRRIDTVNLGDLRRPAGESLINDDIFWRNIQ